MRASFLVVALVPSIASAGTNVDVVPLPPLDIAVAEPVVPIDDTRSYWPTTRNFVDLSVAPTVLADATGAGFQLTSQLAIGVPIPSVRELREVYDELHLTEYQFRVRDDVFAGQGAATGGPMTFALQRYFPVNPLAIDPLLFAHFGIEAAISTPWLSGRDVVPTTALQIVDGPQRELSSNGWSIRPVSAYVRGDFLACRSESAEVGIEPELFVPQTGDLEYATRFHVAAGFSLGCKNHIAETAPKVAVEYEGRILMYAGDSPVEYAQSLAVALQVNMGAWMLQLFYKADPAHVEEAGAYGVRIQVGAHK